MFNYNLVDRLFIFVVVVFVVSRLHEYMLRRGWKWNDAISISLRFLVMFTMGWFFHDCRFYKYYLDIGFVCMPYLPSNH